MQLMWEGLPGNTTVRTGSFIVTKNGHIHQTAHFSPVANAWQHRLRLLDTTECQHPTLQCSWEHMKTLHEHKPVLCGLTLPLLNSRFKKVSPGGVHASTEDWTNTDRLLEGIGIFLSLYFAKAAWTASVCKSKRAHRHRLATEEHQAFGTLWQYEHMITRSKAFIPGVGCPGLVVFGTWENSLGGGLDPVVNLQRRIYTCREMRPKQAQGSL